MVDRKEYMKEYSKKYRKEHKDYFKECMKKYREAEKYKQWIKEYYQKNKDFYKERNRSEKYRKYAKEYYQNNKDYIKEYSKEYCKTEKRKQYVKEYFKEYAKNRRKSDPQYKLSNSISRSIWNSLQSGKSGHHWEDLVGYTIEDLMEHLASQFRTGMRFDNYGKVWHIDHIIPVSLWEFTSPEDDEFQKCWALANLQPLYTFENLSKSNRTINLNIGDNR